jgi:hypothetical protein
MAFALALCLTLVATAALAGDMSDCAIARAAEWANFGALPGSEPVPTDTPDYTPETLLNSLQDARKSGEETAIQRAQQAIADDMEKSVNRAVERQVNHMFQSCLDDPPMSDEERAEHAARREEMRRALEDTKRMLEAR